MIPSALAPLPDVATPSMPETSGVGLWTASTEVVIPGASIPPEIFQGLMSFYALAGFLVLLGAFLSYRHRRPLGYLTMGAGIVTSLSCFTFVVFWGHVVGQPPKDATAAYAYTGSRLTSLVQDAGGIIEKDVVEGRIVQVHQVSLTDGSHFALVMFDNGEMRRLSIDDRQMKDLLQTLKTQDSLRSVGFGGQSI